MGRFILFSIFIMAFFFACKEDDEFESLNVEISSGFICGWCEGADSIIMNENEYVYVEFNPCSYEAFHPKKYGNIDAGEWNEMLRLLDFDTFRSIDLNQCNVCFDGCDYWVKVKQGAEIHRITFGRSKEDSLTLKPVLPFIEKLDKLKTKLIEE